MNYHLIVEVTGEKPEDTACSTNKKEPLQLTSCGLEFRIRETGNGGLPEYEISFLPEKEIRLHSVTIRINASENNIGADKPVYVFDNGLVTNTFAGIRRLDAASEEVIRSRELVTMHREAGNLNAAFTTFERFYTEFHTDCRGISAIYYLEDKPVHAGETYVLESLVMEEELDGLAFFEQYTELLHEKYRIQPMKPVPAGWSSWSCLYGSVDETSVLSQAKQISEEWRSLGADLIQIDDGWQKEGSFGAYWTNNPEKFSHDIPWLSAKCQELGLAFGLWMAPGMLIDTSSRFEELRPCLNTVDGKLVKHFGGDDTLAAEKNGSVYGLDIGQEKAAELLREMFSRGVKEYGAEYFKIDFIVNLLLRAGNGFTRVEYDSGYAVELYRRYVKEIRKTVGDEVFLLACGAPIGESVGIFDSIRISADIAWGGAGKPHHPGAWNIIRNDAQCAILRSPFHGKVFINDPDALLVRDFQTPCCDDGLTLTLEEAKMWATVVAMSGGHILINEELDRLTEERKALFANILPPLGLAARPRDFYEYPWCTETFLAVDDETQLCAVYNWGEEEMRKEVRNPFPGAMVLVDCWSHQIIGCMEDTMEFVLPVHTCRAFLMKRLPETGGFLYSDGNFYLGAGTKRGNLFYYFPEKVPDGFEAVQNELLEHMYVKK